MSARKILGIDYGAKNIGIALGDVDDNIVIDYEMIPNKNQNFVIGELTRIVLAEGIDAIVVGLPLGLNGRDTEQTARTRKFIELLKKSFDILIDTEDERFTSKDFDRLPKDFKKISNRDAIAAMKILEIHIAKIKNSKLKNKILNYDLK